MVNTIILSEYSLNPPAGKVGRVKISASPLYELLRVQALVRGTQLNAWTDKCRKDVYKWFDGDLERVAALILMLTPKDYIDSEWCENGKGAIAACDAYRLNLTETAPATGQPVQMEYFVKFAVSKTGALVLIVSCHA